MSFDETERLISLRNASDRAHTALWKARAEFVRATVEEQDNATAMLQAAEDAYTAARQTYRAEWNEEFLRMCRRAS